MAAIVECENLIKIHKQGTLEVVALQGLDFAMDEGEFVSVVGRSGSGKSTLLQIIAGLETPSAGRVVVAGTDVGDLGARALVRHYRNNVGFLWQDFTRNLLPYLRVLENVELPMALAGVGARKRRARAMELLEATGMRSRVYAAVDTLSGGEQQRVALCVALALAPRLLLADEPTGELDTATSLEVYELLRDLSRAAGLSVLVVTHDVVLARRSDRVVRLADGRLVSDRAPTTATSLAVDGSGGIRLPRDLLLAAGIDERVRARLVEDGILLQPENGEEQS